MELSKLDGQILGTSAPPGSTAPLSCSIDIPTDAITEASLSPDKAGSLLSVQSAPPEQRERPASLLLELPLATQVGAYLSAMSPTEQEEDSLLTLSSVTARPLLAASRKLRPQPESTESISPPDGGYGWVVVFGAFMVQFWVAGLFKSYGVLYVEIMETFPDSSESVASWIPAALSTLCLALAPLSSALCEKYSCRLVVFIGGLFCATGLALSYFSTGLFHLLLSFGVMTGIGGGLSTTPGIVIVSQYFDKHRALANGICVSGTAAGSFVFPMLIEKLVDMYGLHGTVLLLGGGMLHVCVSATLYRPAPVCTTAGDRTPGTTTTTTTEHTTLLHDITEGKTDPGKDNRLQNLFNPDGELALNQKNAQLDDKRTNLFSEIMHPSLIEVARQQLPAQQSESEDSEGLDVLGVVGLPREVARLRLRPTRSSSILHSVEDLSTDSTCVYKASRRKLSRTPGRCLRDGQDRLLLRPGLVRDVTGGYSWCFYGMGSCMVLGTIPVIAFHISTKNEDSDSSVD
ncbi:hypothetical protein O3G_MSEX013343 [Manduca sexta]|uniref:Monocarboxylate transporter 12 n=1 Tax=Manduca sexta TaxID=7130 RepID=A0A922CXW4_MANSE|nr:hypothetical protein O3G_MSEX013343 [Manduca sexta]